MLVVGVHSSALATKGEGDVLGVEKTSSSCIVELTEAKLGESREL